MGVKDCEGAARRAAVTRYRTTVQNVIRCCQFFY